MYTYATTAASANLVTGVHPVLKAVSVILFQVLSAKEYTEKGCLDAVSSNCFDISETKGEDTVSPGFQRHLSTCRHDYYDRVSRTSKVTIERALQIPITLGSDHGINSIYPQIQKLIYQRK